jgi:hypothetical protein
MVRAFGLTVCLAILGIAATARADGQPKIIGFRGQAVTLYQQDGTRMPGPNPVPKAQIDPVQLKVEGKEPNGLWRVRGWAGHDLVWLKPIEVQLEPMTKFADGDTHPSRDPNCKESSMQGIGKRC